jgi:hypothetical protein
MCLLHKNVLSKWLNLPPQTLMVLPLPIVLIKEPASKPACWHLTQHNVQGLDHSIVHKKVMRPNKGEIIAILIFFS